MVRKRTIKKYDNGWVIRLLQSDVEDLGIQEGDLIDLDDCVIISKELDEIKEEGQWSIF